MSVTYRVTVVGSAGRLKSPLGSHQAVKWFQSDRYARRVPSDLLARAVLEDE
jgi:hypothetical protein